MSRLEEIEKFLAGGSDSDLLDPVDYRYALDCYKARVAVLEEALENYANKRNWANKTFSYQDPWLDAEETLALTPEECLERQSRTHKDSLLVGEEG